MYRTTRTLSGTRSIVCTTVVAAAALAAFTGPAGASSTGTTGEVEKPFSRACFMVRSQWNEALDGPQPTCPVPVHAVARAHDYSEPAPEHGFTRRHW